MRTNTKRKACDEDLAELEGKATAAAIRADLLRLDERENIAKNHELEVTSPGT